MAKLNRIACLFILSLFILSLISAVSVTDVSQSEIFPGESGRVKVILKNNLNEDVTDVSFNLILSQVPFISVGSSEGSEDEIREGKEKEMSFNLKASQDAIPGDYNIPFKISYKNEAEEILMKEGSIGVVIGADTELRFATELENNVIGKQGKITLRLINAGFADVKFVSVELIPRGYTLISSDEKYVGSIDSDDFETVSYDVIFNEKNSKLIANIKYKDFYNNNKIENIEIPLKVYTEEEALKLGVVERRNSLMYFILIVFVILGWFVYKFFKKRKKNKNAR